MWHKQNFLCDIDCKERCMCPVSTFRIITDCQARMNSLRKVLLFILFRSLTLDLAAKWKKSVFFLSLSFVWSKRIQKDLSSHGRKLCALKSRITFLCRSSNTFGNSENEFALYLGVDLSLSFSDGMTHLMVNKCGWENMDEMEKKSWGSNSKTDQK